MASCSTIPEKCVPINSLGENPSHRFDGFRHEREQSVRVGGEDHVRRVLDEEAVAILRLAELALEPLLLADATHGALDADEPVVLPDRDRRDLGRHARTIPVLEHVAIAPDVVLLPLVFEVRDRLREGLLGRELREGHADDLGRGPAEERLGAFGHEREPALGVGPIDHVGCGLDELSEARLRLLELSFQAIALAHVADRAVRAGEGARVVEPRRGHELGRDRFAVGSDQIEPAAQLLARIGHPGGPVHLGDLAGRLVHEGAEVLPDEGLGSPPGQPLDRVRQERDPAVRPDRPHEIRRILDEEPIALLGLGQAGEEPRVRDRDRGLIGEPLEQVEFLGLELARRRGRDRERADHLAARRAQRSGGHTPQTEPVRDVLIVRVVRDPGIVEIVGRCHWLTLLRGQPVDPAAEREALAEQPGLGRLVRAAGDDDRDEIGPVVGHPRQVRAVRGQQPLGLLDDALEDDVGFLERRDARGDVAQGPLGLGAMRDRLSRPFELLDQSGVRDRDGGLVGQTAEHRLVDRVEGMARVAVDLDGPERPLVTDDRRDDEVADAVSCASRSVSLMCTNSAAR